MDSLTQIVLGAACGEVALGKKIGNKALLFGAIGGTIPDMDVFIGPLLYSNEIQAMAYHRGFTHSFLFAILGCFVFGFIFYKLYNREKRKGTTELKDWIWLFFLALFTHPILDSFTPYGTQLFMPFSNYRVAFNTISVVDPLYTVPFLICLIIAMFFNRKSRKRTMWVKSGIYISCFYLVFTVGNRFYINSVFKRSFKAANIEYSRFRVQPTILNNILWYGIAEAKTHYNVAFYSLFDKKSVLDTILTLPKNHHLLDMSDPDLKTLTWFSNDYYNLTAIDTAKNIRYSDLRYPLLNADDINSSIFSFELLKKDDRWTILQSYGPQPTKDDTRKFWERIKGI